MLDLAEVEESIYTLENNLDTTRENCILLASLYLIRSNYKTADNVESELSDILPAYRKYCQIKREFQMRESSAEKVLHYMNMVCTELSDLIQTLYSSTDMPEERECLIKTLKSISFLS